MAAKTVAKPIENDLEGALAVAEVSSITAPEREALQGLVEELRRIDERAQLAITTVTQAIKTQAVVAKGRALLEVERRLEGFTEENRNSRLLPLLRELGGPDERTAKTWMAAALSVESNAYLTGGEDFLLNFTPQVLTKLQELPESKRADLIEEAQTGKTKITAKKIKEVAAQPDTQRDATAEALEKANQEKERLVKELEALKRDMTVVTDDPEYQRVLAAQQKAVEQVTDLEEKYEELKKEARAYKQQAFETAKKLEEVSSNEEAEAEEAKRVRIRKISSTLPNRIPDVLADIQRFHAEEKDFDPEVRGIIINQIKTLAAFIIPNYVNSQTDL
jgi:hypothetical protein